MFKIQVLKVKETNAENIDAVKLKHTPVKQLKKSLKHSSISKLERLLHYDVIVWTNSKDSVMASGSYPS